MRINRVQPGECRSLHLPRRVCHLCTTAFGQHFYISYNTSTTWRRLLAPFLDAFDSLGHQTSLLAMSSQAKPFLAGRRQKLRAKLLGLMGCEA